MVEKTQNTSEAKEDTVAPLDLRSLFVAGVHFGHPTKRWNPKMNKFIYGKRSSAHIIDINRNLYFDYLPKQLIQLKKQKVL